MNMVAWILIGTAGIALIVQIYLVGYVDGGDSKANKNIHKMAQIQAQRNTEGIVEGGVYKFFTLSKFNGRRLQEVGVVKGFDFSDSIEVEDCHHVNFSVNTLDLIKVEELSCEEAEKFKQIYNLH